MTQTPQNKLLVADDSITIQKVIRLALSSEGYEIQGASEGNEALQKIAVFRPAVVLVDVSLPGKSAFEIKQEISADPDRSHIQFVLMSSAFEKIDEARVSSMRFAGRLTKPFDPAHLREVLAQAFAQSTPPREPSISLEIPTPEPSIAPPPPASKNSSDRFAKTFAQTSKDDSPDSDIRSLTESTIKLSGLDDFQWSVQEPPKKGSPPKAPFASANPPPEAPVFTAPIAPPREEVWTPPPLPPSLDKRRTDPAPPSPPAFDFPREYPTRLMPEFVDDDQTDDPALDPVLELVDDEDDKRGSRISGISLTPPPPPPGSPPPTIELETDDSTKFDEDGDLDPRRYGLSDPLAPPPPAEHVEQIVKEQVEKALRKLAQEMLPEMAEKLIKEEIHRMLAEPPGQG